jgi:hypothetical protein
MEDSLLDGIDEASRFVEGTNGLSLTEVMISVVCGMAGVYDDREIACTGGRVQLSPSRELVGECRMQTGMAPCSLSMIAHRLTQYKAILAHVLPLSRFLSLPMSRPSRTMPLRRVK